MGFSVHIRDFESDKGVPFETFTHKQQLTLTVSDKTIFFGMEAETDNQKPPSPELIGVLQELVDAFLAEHQALAEKIFEAYQKCCKTQPDWMESSKVAIGLPIEDVFSHHVSGGLVKVVRDAEGEGEEAPYRARLSVDVQWDEEHGLVFAYENGSWVAVDY